ncbi:GNAT family N-acetyltransferase [Fluoribacter gormanii]|uniref:Aminoglycoside 6'-N-acetyltransferase n=1 Tax=Fluoribacter gormanii TaxID=464 RepID=A0A377GJJ5_9GAMM|nr:GNAT family N-acetyltransferase [Fluoribacter gormanii]KTD03474.1 aminoglycoside 6'-N-acetyltransferase [Fluoribacter gormanii]SIQ47106.1 aminoglycoside 6'-N-acetyltransferase [Fluoribacter gormanii]STO24502.1 Bifunctional AAC/APH [Fluoribacter gormanii]
MTYINQSKSFVFKALNESDLILLYHWFQEPTIKQWYARGQSWSFDDIKQKYLPRILGKDNVPSFIIYIDALPLGFIQYYCLNDYLPEGIWHKNHRMFQDYHSNKIAGIDLFIAPSNQRGKGLGKQILDLFITELPNSICAILVDPEIHNHQAIRCYEKAGFKRTDYSEDKAYLILLKHLD